MLLGFNILAVLGTLAGGVIPLAKDMLSRQGMWRLFALRSGILLSVTFTQILPEAWAQKESMAGWGALAAFTLLLTMESFSMMDSCPEYLEECSVHVLSWTAVAALFVHSFIDGFNLSVSFAAGSLAGAAVGLALGLHKLVDGFTLTALFQGSGYGRRQTLAGLFAIAVATPLGSFLSHRGLAALSPGPSALLLGFAGGSFLYIGASDVLRRMHKADDKLSLACFSFGMFATAALKGI